MQNTYTIYSIYVVNQTLEQERSIFLNGGFFIFVLFYTFYTFNKLFVVFDAIPYFVARVDLHINVYEKKLLINQLDIAYSLYEFITWLFLVYIYIHLYTLTILGKSEIPDNFIFYFDIKTKMTIDWILK
jgi:hypothetical protein